MADLYPIATVAIHARSAEAPAGPPRNAPESRVEGSSPVRCDERLPSTGSTTRQAPRRRRRFSAEYKLDILRRVDACTERGEISELLRREGLYFSHLTKWRREREKGALEALRAKRPGPKSVADKELAERLVELEGEVRLLRSRLERAERRLAHRQPFLHKTAGLVSREIRNN